MRYPFSQDTYLENRIQREKYPMVVHDPHGGPSQDIRGKAARGSGRREISLFCQPSLMTGKERERSRREEQTRPPHVTLYVRGSSQKERRVDALALRADERRDKLRKASGRSKYPMIRRFLNGETHVRKPYVSMHESIVHGGEPGELKHLSSRRKRKKHRFRE